MGGPAGSGGSDRSDERKVDTYSDQLKKIQKRKSKTKKDKFGYTVKKSVFERIGDNHPVYQGVKNFADKANLNRRMKFANKTGVNLQGLSTEEILSDDFKSKLEAKGYKTSSNANIGGDDNRSADRNNQKTLSATTMPVETTTEAEAVEPSYEDEEKLTAEEIALRNKRKGRKRTVLTSVTGDTSKATLGKKTLLGA
jgi:putative component of toxin-antitoxin plasmid stabilization module